MKKVLIICYIIFLCLTACQKYTVEKPPVNEKSAKTVSVPGADANVLHIHNEVFEGNNTVEHEFVGYCGNTVTKIRDKNGFEAEFWGSASVDVTDLLRYLNYREESCPCDIEYIIDTEFGKGYMVNLTNRFARNGGGMQISLTNEQINTIKTAVEAAKISE